MQKIRWFFLIIGIVLVLAMALQNNDLVEIQLLWLTQKLPLSVLLLITAGSGFLFGALMTASMLRRRAKKKDQGVKNDQHSMTNDQKEPSSVLGGD